jgi:hypothetical protein
MPVRKLERSLEGGAAVEDEEDRDGEEAVGIIGGKAKGKGRMVGAGTVTSSRKSPRHSGQESSPAAAAEAAMRTVRLHW